jgi:UDP-N-acetylmuramyl pentapeptide synthase
LFEALPAEKRGASHPDPALLAQILLPILRSGDAVTVKGSRGSQPTARMAAVVTAIQQWANQG